MNRDLIATIDRLFPDSLTREAPAGREPEVPAEFESGGAPVAATRSGYVQAVDLDRLASVARERDVPLWLKRRAGHFVVQGGALALVWPPASADERLVGDVNGAFILGMERTAEQDVEFAVTQLVEVALRALSLGVNDPFTAICCVHHLGAALARLAAGQAPSRYRHDEDRRLRVIADVTDFEGATDAAFDQIRQAARTSTVVTMALLETLALMAASRPRTPDDCAVLLRQAAMIRSGSREGLPEPADRAPWRSGTRSSWPPSRAASRPGGRARSARSRRPDGPRAEGGGAHARSVWPQTSSNLGLVMVRYQRENSVDR